MLMGLPVNDVDYVVVGSTPQEMLNLGYTQVGADFPVFLHPDTGEEYALARTERKTGKGYHGFIANADPSVTLEADLQRRDLTCNAMAVSLKGWKAVQAGEVSIEDVIFDPFYGYQDTLNKVINPVREETFVEDPLRVLRAARFAAVYRMAWTHRMYQCAATVLNSGELQFIPSERYAAEIEKTLKQCETAGDVAVFAMILANLNILPPIHGAIARVANQSRSMGAKLNELTDALTKVGIKQVFGSNLGMSNDRIAQMVVLREVMDLAEMTEADPQRYYAVTDAINRAPAVAGWDFIAQTATEGTIPQTVWAMLSAMRGYFQTIRFETHVPPDTEPKLISSKLKEYRIQAWQLAIN